MVRALSEVILTHIILVLGWIGSLHDGFLFEDRGGMRSGWRKNVEKNTAKGPIRAKKNTNWLVLWNMNLVVSIYWE